MNENQPPAPSPQRSVFPSRKRIKEEWAKLDFEPEDPPDNEDQTALNEIYQDDLFGLGNE